MSGCADDEASSDAAAAESAAECPELIEGLSFPNGCSVAPNGAWKLVRYCPFNEGYDPLGGTCDAAAYAVTGSATGQLELRDNGLFRFEYEQRLLNVESSIPTSCYGGGDFCRGSALGGECMVDGASCNCSEQRIELSLVEQGQWSARSGTVRFDFSSGMVSEQNYCLDASGEWLLMERPAGLGLPGTRMLFRRT